MSAVYISRLEEKIEFTFNILDFNFDGKVSAADATLLLSFIDIDGMVEEQHA